MTVEINLRKIGLSQDDYLKSMKPTEKRIQVHVMRGTESPMKKWLQRCAC